MPSTQPRPRALFAMGCPHRDALFPPTAVQRLTRHVDIDPQLVAEDFGQVPDLATVELLITSWGCPRSTTPCWPECRP